MEELKVRIKNYEKLRSKLEKLGTIKEKEENIRDNYFKIQGDIEVTFSDIEQGK